VPRAFLAVAVPPLPALLRALGTLRALGPAVRPVAPENLHITLRFLGETPAQSLPAIASAVRTAAADTTAFEFELVSTGLFPDSQRPAVVWAGTRGAEPLQSLVAQLTPGLAELGLVPEDRPWVCHLTLARIRARPPAELHRFLEKTREQNFGRVRVAALDLMLSTLTPHGPQYAVAHSVALR
jgi:2'-5' RNA ligase